MSANDPRYHKIAVAWSAFFAPIYLIYLLDSSPPHDGLGDLIGRDFLSTWMGARSALADGPIKWFDFATYSAALHDMFGPSLQDHNWSYPPHVLLLTWPLGLIDYIPAYVIWCAAGLALFLLVVTAGGAQRNDLSLLALSPAVAMNVMTGQIGFVTTSLLIGGLKLLDRRPVLAGICFGILTVKPQLGILIPLMLIMTRQWIAIVTGIATVAAMAATTAWLYGWSVWTEYFRVAMPFQERVLVEGTGIMLSMMPTPFINGRVAHWPIDYARAAQALISTVAIAAVCWTFARRRDPARSMAVLVTASFLVTPYVFCYDMIVFGWVIAILLARKDSTAFDHGLAVAVWMLPVITLLLGLLGTPGSCLVLVAFLGRLTWRLAVGKAPAARSDALPHPDATTLPSPKLAPASS
jgi:hypothetical protein